MVCDQQNREKKTAYTGVEGLFKLWQEAMSMYRTAVVDNHFNCQFFAEDFINSRTFHDSDDTASRNDHAVNLGRINRLLKSEEIIRRYFDLPLTEDNFYHCMQEVIVTRQTPMAKRPASFQCHFNDSTLKLIADAANSIPLFKEQVTSQDMNVLFNECPPVLSPILHASVNQFLAYFLFRMDYYGLIGRYYQNTVEKSGLIGSSATGKPLSAHALAHALERINSANNPIKDKIENWVKNIKLASIATQ